MFTCAQNLGCTQGIIEGCTEIVMLVQQKNTDIPLFDTTAIDAEEGVSDEAISAFCEENDKAGQLLEKHRAVP